MNNFTLTLERVSRHEPPRWIDASLTWDEDPQEDKRVLNNGWRPCRGHVGLSALIAQVIKVYEPRSITFKWVGPWK